MIRNSFLEDQYGLVSKENIPSRGRSVCKAGFHYCLVTNVMEMCRRQIMKGFIHYSEEFNPQDIKKEDLLKCTRKDTISSSQQH